MPARIFCALTMSLDGYIAAPDGGVHWLVDEPTYDFDELARGVTALVMGRGTFDAMQTLGPSPYAHLPAYVLTNRPLLPEGAFPGIAVAEPVEALLARLRTLHEGKVWLFGGGDVVAQALDADAVDAWAIAVQPVVLGTGIRLFPRATAGTRLRLVSSTAYPSGLVDLRYERAA